VDRRSEFGTYLEELLADRKLTARQFGKKVDVIATFLSKVMMGTRPVPVRRIEDWADALKLSGNERERFLELAWLTHTPVYIRELVKRLRR